MPGPSDKTHIEEPHKSGGYMPMTIL